METLWKYYGNVMETLWKEDINLSGRTLVSFPRITGNENVVVGS